MSLIVVQRCLRKPGSHAPTCLELSISLKRTLLVLPLSETGACGKVQLQKMSRGPVSDRSYDLRCEENILKAWSQTSLIRTQQPIFLIKVLEGSVKRLQAFGYSCSPLFPRAFATGARHELEPIKCPRTSQLVCRS